MFSLLRRPVLLVVVAGVIAVIYLYGPSGGGRTRDGPPLCPAALLRALLGASIVFSCNFTTFVGFTEIYGSLSAVIGFLVWIWLSIIAVLVGAELHALVAQCLYTRTDPPRSIKQRS